MTGTVQMPDFITEKKSCWQTLSEKRLPIFLYGMGNGADNILAVMEKYNISPAGVFASDEFVRGHSFRGFEVKTLSRVEAENEDFIIVLAFGAGYPELYNKIREIASRHTLIAPDVPVAGGGLFTYEYALENAEKLQYVYELLADDLSRKTYADIINYKISGNTDYLHACTAPMEEVWENILRPGDSEEFLDMGAYTGDTALEFARVTNGKYNRIFAMEPDPRNYRKLTENTSDLANIHLFNAAAWNRDGILDFNASSGRNASVTGISSGKASGKSAKPAASLRGDSVTETATYIKMDVEGAEKQAIEGADSIIRTGKCKLNIACYHRNEDIFAIPLQIHELCPSLRLYLRHHMYIPAWDTNLYAVPGE